jgi:hypothetical protein
MDPTEAAAKIMKQMGYVKGLGIGRTRKREVGIKEFVRKT